MARLHVRASSEYGEVASALLTTTPLTMVGWSRIPTIGSGLAYTVMAISRASGAVRDSFVCDLLANAGATTLTARALTGAASSSASSNSTNTVGADVWCHVAAVFASSTSRTAYLNGQAATANTTSLTPSSLVRTSIGRIANFNSAAINYQDGPLAELGLYNAALSPDDIASLAAGMAPPLVRLDALVEYWPWWGRYSPEVGLRNRNEMTLTGTAVADHPRILYPARTQVQKWATAAAGGSVLTPYYYQSMVGAA